MPAIPTITLTHPYWAVLGEAAHTRRTALGLSQGKVAQKTGLSVRDYAALESGYVPAAVHAALSRMPLARLDEALEWDKEHARDILQGSVRLRTSPTWTPESPSPSRSRYSTASWERLGKAVRAGRLALKMTRPVLGYAMRSTSKTIMRLEEGRVYGDPRTAPPGDYNSEKYLLKRLPLLEMALEWKEGEAEKILAQGFAS